MPRSYEIAGEKVTDLHAVYFTAFALFSVDLGTGIAQGALEESPSLAPGWH